MVEVDGAWRPSWVRGGRIEEVAWIGKDVLAWCSGMHLVFYHIIQKRESLRWFPKSANREGVSCLSGHPTMHLLAFADKSFNNPRIFVLSYPSMTRISECLRGSKSGYLGTAFTHAEHLVSLGSHPTFSITIWAWRSGEKLVSVATQIRDLEGQLIRVANSKPTVIAQLGSLSGKLHIWETSPAGRTILLTDHEITLPKGASAHHMDWSSDSCRPLLAVVDRLGNIYICNQDGSEVNRIVLAQRCGVCLEYESPSVAWFRGGIVLRTTFCQIRFYKKDSNDFWHKEWYVKSDIKPCILAVHPSRNDKLFYHTLEGFLMELDMVEGQPNPVTEKILNLGAIYKFLDVVRPWGHHLLAMDNLKEVSIIDCLDGHEVARLNLETIGETTQLLSHPDYPLAVTTSKEGELVLLSLRAPEDPFVVAKFHLQSERLDLIKFSQSGKNLVVGQRTTGVCYCISLTPNKPFTVIARLESKSRMADVLFYDSRGHFKLLVLVVSSRRVPVGRYLILYDLQIGRRGSNEPTAYLELPYGYQFLHYAPVGGASFVATPYLSRHIHFLEIADWKSVKLVDAMPLGHQTRRPRLITDRTWITSGAFDGFVTLRNGKKLKTVTTLNPHHRRDLGVSRAIVTPSGDLVVALGQNGSLVGTRLWRDEPQSLDESAKYCRLDFGEYERNRKGILADYASLVPSIIEMLTRKTEGFPPLKDGAIKTWLEWSEEAKNLEEAEECSQEKMAIQSDFAKLQDRIVRLLNHNEICPELERLPISAFDLDKYSRDQRLKAARDERDDKRLELESNCVSMDRVAAWIKSTFWDSQKIRGQSILAINGATEVTNYPTTADNPDAANMLRLARFFRDSMRNTIETETFSPWKLYTPSKLQLALNRRARLHRVDERQRMDSLLQGEDDEEEHEIGANEMEDRLANEGMTTHRFLVPSNHYYSQFESYGFAQLLLDNRNLTEDCKKLREYFDKSFDEMFAVKEREMKLVLERHERIRHIDSELRSMFGQTVPEMPVDPVWKSSEVPDRTIKVYDHEISVKPYVSESQQELLDKQALESERLRQILLADDFREKALITMMDGVLEVRWEDTIKRDIPKPQCILTKDPNDYDAADLLAIQQYEKDVEFLESERSRYRRILEADYTKTSNMLRDGIDKFDSKLREFSLHKVRVEAAIQQLNLRYIRGCLRHVKRMKFLREDDEIRSKIVAKRKMIGNLEEQLPVFQSLAQEYRNQHEALITRERAVGRRFRKDFPSLGRSIVELLEKEVKRRPKFGLKNATASDLVELGRTVASRNKLTYLPHDCAEYLKHLESLDAGPSGLPPSVESHHWDHLVRIRRNRIELEMKIRAQMAEIHETENTIAEINRKILKYRSDLDLLKEQLVVLRQERVDFDCNIEVQLVLKMGQIEVKPSGGRNDMANAIFIPRKEVEAINEKILKAGAKKLAAMTTKINFSRLIRTKEWVHKCSKMTIEDLEEQLRMVQRVSVTREIREYLEKIEQGHSEKSAKRREKEFEATRKNCEKRLRDWEVRLEDVEAKIAMTRRQNERMDEKIKEMNVDRWELEWQRDIEGESKQKEYHDRRMAIVVQRSKLVRKLQKEFIDILAMQTEHELLRMRRFPMLSCFKTLDDEPQKNL